MNYRIHIPIICLLLILQFFVTDIFGLVYLPMMEGQLKKNHNGVLYRSNEYTPLTSEGPKNFKFVYVIKSGGLTNETYYSKEGNRTTVNLINGKWQSSETQVFSAQAFLIQTH